METPRYEYSRAALTKQAKLLMGLNTPFGLTVRYALKANPHPEIVQLLSARGLHFDASSSFEAQALIEQGVAGKTISLSSQQTATNLEFLIAQGVQFVATSAKQLQGFIDLKDRQREVAIRINPGIGSGHAKRVTTGGVGSSFGIWHENLNEILQMVDSNNIIINRLQFHIGTGSDPKIWSEAGNLALNFAKRIPTVKIINMGGGFKIGYHPDDIETDIEGIVDALSDEIHDFASDHGRKMKLEIEPGRYLVAHAGQLVSTIDDIVDTGSEGYIFLRLDTGMNDFLRTSMYGSYHRIEVVNDSTEKAEYVVVGHNCETGDTLTTVVGDPETLAARMLNKASIGDEIIIHDTGAYCASMRAVGYNGFPDAPEIMVD